LLSTIIFTDVNNDAAIQHLFQIFSPFLSGDNFSF
jgi:hypothetical protein